MTAAVDELHPCFAGHAVAGGNREASNQAESRVYHLA
jgi:hypothetical protein